MKLKTNFENNLLDAGWVRRVLDAPVWDSRWGDIMMFKRGGSYKIVKYESIKKGGGISASAQVSIYKVNEVFNDG